MATIKDRVKKWKFTFISSEKGEHVFKFDPKEWKETEYALQSGDDGIIFTFSGDYTYLRDAYTYLDEGYNEYGVLWNVILKLEYKDNHSFQYETAFDNRKLDFSSVTKGSADNRNYQIPLVDSGFYENIKSREKELIPYSRLTTLDGDPITPFANEYETVNVLGQEIVTTGSGTGTDIEFSSSVNGSSMILDMFFEGNNDNLKSVLPRNLPTDGSENRTTEDAFYVARTDATIEFDFTLNYAWSGSGTHFVYLDVWEYDADGNLVSGSLRRIASTSQTTSGDYTFTYTGTVTLASNEMMHVWSSMNASGGTLEYSTTTYTTSQINLRIFEKENPTDIEHVSLFQAHQRTLEAMTGVADSFVSTPLDVGGEWAHIYVSNGFLYRQYTTDESQLAFKWTELKQFCENNLGLRYGLINDNGTLKIACEQDTYFYQDEVGLVIDKIEKDSLTIDTDIDLYYSAIECGTQKKDYEQQSGLLVTTTDTKYSTILGIIDNVYDLKTKYQIDGNWHEFTRRLKKDAEETTDSQYDNDIAVMEAIDIEGVLTQRTTQDFERIEGIDGITTPINLNLTAARSLIRNGKWIRVGLEKYLTSTINFDKSEVKTTLSTLRNDEGIEVFENTDIDPSSLDQSIFTGEVAKCNGDVKIYHITAFEENPYRRIQIPNDIDGGVLQGWVKTLSTKPVGDSLTNIEIYVARDIVTTDDEILWNSGESIDWKSEEAILWKG